MSLEIEGEGLAGPAGWRARARGRIALDAVENGRDSIVWAVGEARFGRDPNVTLYDNVFLEGLKMTRTPKKAAVAPVFCFTGMGSGRKLRASQGRFAAKSYRALWGIRQFQLPNVDQWGSQ